MIALMCALAAVPLASACTASLVGPEASADGNVWVGQSDDGEGAGDSRLVWVPARDWPAGSRRPVVNYGDFPRYVGTERGISDYFPSPALPNSTANVIGYIPQVERTHGYLEGNYAMANDQGVSFGESSCSARVFSLPKPSGPSLLSMYELTRLAAERASSAREAIDVMGELALRYGFFADPVVDTGGESLFVADIEEQWVFHILPESAQAGGAVWAAQRVPRDHVAVVANAFIIGEVDPDDSANFLFSPNMHAVALANRWWDGRGKLHFTRTFSLGEYTSKYYSGRRQWAFWSELAPSLGVPPTYSSYREAVGSTYPTSARPDAPVTRDGLLRRVYRNYYQGTPYDLSAGPSAGPFGTPARWKPGPGEADAAGRCSSDGEPCNRWERPIASFRSTLVHLSSVATSGPTTLWFLPGAALGGVFVPVVVGAPVPRTLSAVHNLAMDRSVAFHAYRELLQFAYPRWSTVKAVLEATRRQLEDLGDAVIAQALSRSDPGARGAVLAAHANATVAGMRELYLSLVVRFADGWNVGVAPSGGQSLVASRVGYPESWLKDVGYSSDEVQPCSPTCG